MIPIVVNATVPNNIVKKYINSSKCDKILDNGYFTTYYSYKTKTSIAGYSVLYGDKVNAVNIKKRPRYYDDYKIPKKYRSTYKDYSHSRYDRSHQFSNESFNFSRDVQYLTFAMSNILPHYPTTNRKTIYGTEKYSRLIASKLGSVNLLILHVFDLDNLKTIGKNHIAVPKAEVKILWNNDKGFERCLYIPNDGVFHKLKSMVIDCGRYF